MSDLSLELMTVGGGCFWCLDAVFKEVEGVEKVHSGYMGGSVPGIPTYREVSSGLTGHAEVVQVSFDPSVISYRDILFIFMTSHDPTILYTKGGGGGSQYRSVIYYHDDQQKRSSEMVLKDIKSYYDKPIVTENSALKIFHLAEEYHQNYYAKNPTAGYCTAIITQKLKELRSIHALKLKNVSLT